MIARTHAQRQEQGARDIPEATVARLPVYLRALSALADQDITTCSSEDLAAAAGVNSAKLRKDLSYLGSYGTRGVGYDVEYLLFQMSRELGLTHDWPVVIVGIGNLGAALANYGGFGQRGFPVAALVDADSKKVGKAVGELTVQHIDDLPSIVGQHGIARQELAHEPEALKIDGGLPALRPDQLKRGVA